MSTLEMNEKITIALQPIEKVVRVYSGRPGCMCGCNGNYWPEDTNGTLSNKDKKQLNKIYNIFKSAKPEEVFTYESAKTIFVCYDNKTTNRHYVMYYK